MMIDNMKEKKGKRWEESWKKLDESGSSCGKGVDRVIGAMMGDV